ncbi:MAG: hypothetical protein WCD75_05320 [Rhodoplanes sp.]
MQSDLAAERHEVALAELIILEDVFDGLQVPIATGRWYRVVAPSIVEPIPGNLEPMRVKKSDVAQVETPRASMKCSSRLGLPVSDAHSLRSARFSERSIETESPA